MIFATHHFATRREPSDLLHRTDVMQDREETFTIEIFDGKVDIWGEQATLRRAIDLGDLMARFSMYVGDSNYTFTRHDQPACALGWYHKEKMVELAAMGECQFFILLARS